MAVEACLEGLEILAEEAIEPCKMPQRDSEFEKVLDIALQNILQNPEFRRGYERQEYENSFKANKAAFEVKKPGLIEKYPEKFVTVHEGVPVLIGDNLIEVCKEFFKQYGKRPCYIGFLGDEPIAETN